MEIKVMQALMEGNQKQAEKNRSFFKDNRIAVVNVMASPGAGKTSLILKVMSMIGNCRKIYVIEGDIASSIDAEKIEKAGGRAIQINTAGACHLDANVISECLADLAPQPDSLLFIENVGNLICPSSFDLGETVKLVIASVPEGDDKPYKYVPMFEAADAFVLSKSDLLPYIEFNKEYFFKGIRTLNPDAPIFELSCKSGDGMSLFTDWLLKQ